MELNDINQEDEHSEMEKIITILLEGNVTYSFLSYPEKASYLFNNFGTSLVIKTILLHHKKLDIDNNVGFYKTIIIQAVKSQPADSYNKLELIELVKTLNSEYSSVFTLDFSWSEFPKSQLPVKTQDKTNISKESKKKCRCQCKSKCNCYKTCKNLCCSCFGGLVYCVFICLETCLDRVDKQTNDN